MSSKRVLMMFLLLASLAAAPAVAYTDCFTYHYTVCDDHECCTQNCHECDFYAPDGTPQGYILSCTEEGCVPRVN
jgi:hypothetical protein